MLAEHQRSILVLSFNFQSSTTRLSWRKTNRESEPGAWYTNMFWLPIVGVPC